MTTKDELRKLKLKQEQVVLEINNSLKRELLKEENLVGFPKRLKEVVSLYGAEYTVYSKKVKNPFESEVELQFHLTEEYLCRGYIYQIRCTMFRGIDLGLIKTITSAEIADVKVV